MHFILWFYDDVFLSIFFHCYMSSTMPKRFQVCPRHSNFVSTCSKMFLDKIERGFHSFQSLTEEEIYVFNAKKFFVFISIVWISSHFVILCWRLFVHIFLLLHVFEFAQKISELSQWFKLYLYVFTNVLGKNWNGVPFVSNSNWRGNLHL